MTISNKQKAWLHQIKNQQLISDKEYREILHDAAGVTSSIDLDQFGFDKVLDQLAALGYVELTVHNRPNYGERPGFATPAQLRYIDGLRINVFGEETDEPFRRWLEHFFHTTHPRFLSMDIARKVIEALKDMDRRSTNQGNKTTEEK